MTKFIDLVDAVALTDHHRPAYLHDKYEEWQSSGPPTVTPAKPAHK